MAGIDSYTKLLLHLNNDVIDSETTPKTVSNSGVTFDNSIYKFGYSGVFNGSGYLTVPASSDWGFGTGDFTIDFWVYFNNTNQYACMISPYDSGSSRFNIDIGSTNSLNFKASDSGTVIADFKTPNNSITTGQWYHVAYVRNGANHYIFINGISQSLTYLTTPNISTNYPTVSNVLYIGRQQYGYNFNGYMDELRISKGTARWTNNFTPESSEYSAGLTQDISDTTHLSDNWIFDTIPYQEDISETLTLSENWFTEDSPKFESFSETIIFSDNYSFTHLIKSILNTKFNWKLLFTSGIRTSFSWLLAKTINTNFRWLGQSVSKINTDFRWLTNPYSILNPIKDIDIQILINGTDVLAVNDLDIRTGNIQHTIGQKSTANFTLARKHDDLDRTHLGVGSQITNQNPIQIYIAGHLEFDGFISAINVNSESETVQVTALMDEPADNRHSVSLPLPSVNEKIHLYHCLVNSVQIDNPKEDTRAVIIGSNGRYWNGSSWVYRIEEAQVFTTDNDADTYITNYIDESENQIFVIQSPSVTSREKSPQYFKGVKVNLGKRIQQQVDSGYQLENIFDGKGVIAASIEAGTFIVKPNYSYFWSVSAKNIRTGQEMGDMRYIGTSLGSLATDLWVVTGASPTFLRVRDNIETELGYYYIGTAPYKEISTKNGQLIIAAKYQDRDDGLYHTYDASYNYVDYAKIVAELEYEKLLNVGGNIIPITSANIDITFDAYYYYTIKLLTRINVTNTTIANTFNNTNGFPTSVKGIAINFSTMKVTLTTDNRLSQEEIDEIDSQMPDETNPIYSVPEKAVLVYRKFDLKTWWWVT